MGDARCCYGRETENGTSRMMMRNLNDDAIVAQWIVYLIYCHVENKGYLLREEKMAILIVLKYGRRLDP